jgi:hypothetical protein
MMNFEATQEEKMEIIDLGRKSAEEYLKKPPGRKAARRFSLG